MNTKSIELELLYENAYGKIYINKNYHIIDVETEEPEEFFDSLAKATEILGEEYTYNKNKSFEDDFIYTQTAAIAVQTCTLIHKHGISWDPMMAAMHLMVEQEGIDDPRERIEFMLKTILNL